MSATFTVLASGSSGNAALLRAGSFGLLIDIGIGPRTLARRLAEAGFSWNDVHAVVITHTHGDHWRERSLAHLASRKRPIYCHDTHIADLRAASREFGDLLAANLVQSFADRRSFSPGGNVRLQPLEVSHDSHRTFGFRIECDDWAIGYAADLGGYDDALLDALTGLDVLALEFNHDEAMLRSSGRPRELIDRILGPAGHLSNRQATDFLGRVLQANGMRPRCVVPLHLSRECNTPKHATAAANAALCDAGHEAEVVIAAPDRASKTVTLKEDDLFAACRQSSAG